LPLKKIKVISLEKSVERRAVFTRNNPNIDYEFFPAVDGSLLPAKEIENGRFFVKPLPFPSLGAYGAALSHSKIWDLVIQSDTPLTVAEDDAIFRADFFEKHEQVISELPRDWHFVLWGWNFDSILSIDAMPGISSSVVVFDQEQLRNNIEKFKSDTSPVHAFRLDKCFGIPAYTISLKGAEIFKNSCFPMRNFELFFPLLNKKVQNTGIDLAMNKIYGSTNSYVSFPPLAVTRNEISISTVQTR
jgi:GR25 family glycosyltransferase involved in LPS biosynthesis